MTVILGIKHDGMVTMCADTCVSSKSYTESYQPNEYGKINLMPNGVIFAMSGRACVKSLVLADSDMFNFADESFTRASIAREFVPRLRELQKRKDLLDNGGTSSVSVMLAKDDKLYVMTQNWNVYSVNQYGSIGCGKNFAYSNMVKQEGNPEDRIVNACKFASKNCSGVGGPYVVVNTKDKVFKEVR